MIIGIDGILGPKQSSDIFSAPGLLVDFFVDCGIIVVIRLIVMRVEVVDICGVWL